MHQAKSQLSRLVERAQKGEEVILARDGKPVARLVPIAPEALQPRIPGGWEGRVRISDDFDELPPDLLAGFTGQAPE